MKNNKLAKDIAFAKERAKYRKQIWELKSENCSLANTVMDLNGMAQKQDEKITELQDWIERLLEYTGLSKDEMRKIIQKDKDAVDAAERLKDMEKLLLDHTVFVGFLK